MPGNVGNCVLGCVLCFRPECDTGGDGAGLLHLLPVALPQGPGLLQGLQVHVFMKVPVQVLLDEKVLMNVFLNVQVCELLTIQVYVLLDIQV